MTAKIKPIENTNTMATKESELDAIERRVLGFLESASKETDGLKTILANQLTKAATTYELLDRLGVKSADGKKLETKSIFKDKMFHDALSTLGLSVPKIITSTGTGAIPIGEQINGVKPKRNKREDIVKAIQKVLEGDKKLGASEILAAINPLLGNPITAMGGLLDELIKEKTLKDEGEFKTRKFFLPPDKK